MDLKDFITTSTYAIDAVYSHFWSFIPDKYKLPETDYNIKELAPFYDPELLFENRLHYKLSKIAYPNRTKPWFIITWNTENGLFRSSLNQRRYLSHVCENEKYGKFRFKYINTELNVNFGIYCNSMEALFELQENIVLWKRAKMTVMTKMHPLIGTFPVALDILNSTQSKLEREKGTLAYLFLQCTIDYPIIGNIEFIDGGIIERINNNVYKEEGDAPQPIIGEVTITTEDSEI